ncbi:MAG: SurA N-terminal domain-containing protein [Clostridiales bacterium]|nr:SurA N-terminal domain-containing protein [Clostridiales bacterium]
MKLNKTLVRILAVVLIAAMSAGLFGCVSSYNNNPIVAKVGKQKLDLNQYLSLYNNTDTNSNIYYLYLQYGLLTREKYAERMLDELVNYGVQLDQVEVQNITLDSEEEAKLQQDVDDNIKQDVTDNFLSKVDSKFIDEAAKYEEALRLFKEALKQNGSSYDKYRKSLEEALRKTALINKLHDITVADVSVTLDDVKAYFEENAKTATSVTNFRSTFEKFITKEADALPFRMPQPEKPVEDDPDTEDTDESKEADPYGNIFSVLHVLMKFAKEPGSDVTDLTAYAAEDEEFTSKMSDFEASLSSLTKEQFLEKCFDKEVCDDPGMLQPSYQYFGYMMQKSLIDTYYEGFGYAAMKLRFGDEWKPEAPASTDTTAEPAEPKEYELTYFTLADNTKVVKVYTTAGAHYIILNPNDCYGMYDEDGYFKMPLFENDEVITDGEGVVTANGHMTQEEYAALNELFAKAAKTIEIKDEDNKTAEDGEEGDTETPDATEAPETGDSEEEEDEPVTAKSIFETAKEAKLNAMQADVYNAKFAEWKENTKIKTYPNIIKPFAQG